MQARIFTVIPMRNEASRYLQAAITHAKKFSDGVLCIDDDSNDRSLEVAGKCLRDGEGHFPEHQGMIRKPLSVPGLLENECEFRRYVNETAADFFDPLSGTDWILVNDADEFLACTHNSNVRRGLHAVLDAALGVDSFIFGLDELWRLKPSMKRADKAWGQVSKESMFRYHEGMSMAPRNVPLACGSIPARIGTKMDVSSQIRVVHAGYATKTDRDQKYARYKDLSGHSPAHIRSIIDNDPKLVPLEGYRPEIIRGTW